MNTWRRMKFWSPEGGGGSAGGGTAARAAAGLASMAAGAASATGAAGAGQDTGDGTSDISDGTGDAGAAGGGEGGEGAGAPADGAPDGGGEGGRQAASSFTFTQRALTDRLARERRRALEDFRGQLGLPADMTPEQVRELLAEKRAREDAEKTELQRERDTRIRLEREYAEAQAKWQEAEDQRFLSSQATAAGFLGKPSVLQTELGEWCGRQIDGGLMDSDHVLDDKDMAAFFAELKEESPYYFGQAASAAAGQRVTTGGDGGASGRRAAPPARAWDATQHKPGENRSRVEDLIAKSRNGAL